jgi:hypothetical protein
MDNQTAVKFFLTIQKEKTIKAIGLLNYDTNPIVEKMNTDYIFAQLCEDKVSVLRHIIETVENRPSIDDDWRQLIITQQVNNMATIIKKEEIYYKQKHVGTLSFRLEKFTAFFDFTPA